MVCAFSEPQFNPGLIRTVFEGVPVKTEELDPAAQAGGAPLMKIEARPEAFTCLDLEEPWSFTGKETTFYR